MLDLGVWMSIQSSVEKTHRGRRCQADALAWSIEDSWNNYLSPQAFANVFNRLRVVLACIVDGKGGNDKVEEKRGVLHREATIIDLTEEYTTTSNNENENENNNILSLQNIDEIECDFDYSNEELED